MSQFGEPGPTEYAGKNQFEAFAEDFRFYETAGRGFKESSPNRYAFMDKVMTTERSRRLGRCLFEVYEESPTEAYVRSMLEAEFPL
jgi:hypothetical protein